MGRTGVLSICADPISVAAGWRSLLLFAVFMVAAFCFSGCNRDQGSPADESPGTLRVGTPMKIRQTNPLADYHYAIVAMLATHDTLVRFNSKMAPVPQLAKSWHSSPDADKWTFQLVENARWHDGKPVTADDVKFTFNYMADHHGASAWIKNLIEDIAVKGWQVTFVLKRPYSRFLINVGFIIRILPSHIWRDVESPLQPGNAHTTLGCGPYMFEKFDVRENRITFRKNMDYYGPEPSMEYLDILTHRSFDNLAFLLMRNDVDVFYKYASGFSPPHLPKLKEKDAISILCADSLGIPAALGFNLKQGVTLDLSFRKALVYAFDYEKLGKSLLADAGKIPSAGFIPPALSKGEKLPVLVYSPDKAKKAFFNAGYRDTDQDGRLNHPDTGENLILTLLSRSDLEGMDALIPILSHNLSQVGIGLKIEKADLSAWITRVRQQQHDLVLFRTTPWGMLMEAGAGTGYFDSRRKGGGTLSNVSDPEFHRLCDRILETTDSKVTNRLYRDIRDYYAGHLPVVALCWSVNAYPFAQNLKGLVINPVEGGVINRETFQHAKKTSSR